MANLRRVYFQSHKLVATVLPPGSRPKICPSDTCCQQSGGCRATMLIPPVQLTDVDLRKLINELRSKMDAEQQGIEIVIATRSDQDYSNATRTLEGVIGPAVDVPKY
jgi:hypothetical protein